MALRPLMPTYANIRPTELPAATSVSASVTSCRERRARDAPSALRTAISRRRLSARTNSRLDTLTHAISSSNPAPPSSTSRMGLMSAAMNDDRDTTLAAWARFESGYCFSNCSAIAFISASARFTVMPSFSRATPSKSRQSRCFSQSVIGRSGA